MTDIQFFSCDNGLSDICFRMLDGFSHGVAFGKIGGNSGREGTSRSMQIMAFYFFLLIYMVDKFGRMLKVAHIVSFQMSAF